MTTRMLALMAAGMMAAATLSAKDCRHKAMESFPLSDVRITGGMWKQGQLTDIDYMLQLNPDRLLAPFRKEAGLTPKAENYTNWENTGLDGHIGGHYLSALAAMYAATGDNRLAERLDYMLAELQECQKASGNGYLCGAPGGKKIFDEVRRGDIRAGGFDLNGGWVPLYNIHKTFAGLRDAYMLAGRQQALPMLLALTDWFAGVVEPLTDDQVQQMLRSEHGGLNEVLADVASITGDSKYLDLAKRLTHRQISDMLAGRGGKLTGMHANTQIPKVIGMERIAQLDGDTSYDFGARRFWDEVTSRRSVSIGGNSVREHFHSPDDYSSMISSEQGPESCNTYNMLRLSKLLWETTGESKYMDYYERALLNHILSTQNTDKGGFVYFTPMRPGHYRVYSTPQNGMWCCVGTGLENPGRFGEAIYGHSGPDTLAVNLFIPSTLSWNGRTIEQVTGFPTQEQTIIRITPRKPGEKFTVLIRKPSWVNPKGEVTVNGKVRVPEKGFGYLAITDNWNPGDEIKVELPMHLSAEGLPDGSGWYSFLYGPTVLAARTGTEDQTGLFADDSRGGHIAAGPKTPLHLLPAIIENDTLSNGEPDLMHHLTPGGSLLHFTLTGLNDKKWKEGVELEPFNSITESRYQIYFPVYTSGQWKAEKAHLERLERELAELSSVTTDMVTCGEQQPESDHFITKAHSGEGDDDGRRWRDARKEGSFSYRIARPAEGGMVFVTYRPQKGKGFIVEADGVKLGEVAPMAADGPEATASFPIAPTSAASSILTVKPLANDNSTPHIYEVRSVKESAEGRQAEARLTRTVSQTSPDGRVALTVTTDAAGHPSYTLLYDGNPLVADSPLGLEGSLGNLGEGMRILSFEKGSRRAAYTQDRIKKSHIDNTYNTLAVRLGNKNGGRLVVEWALGDNDAAFRYHLPSQKMDGEKNCLLYTSPSPRD